jgi:hypothetical protein
VGEELQEEVFLQIEVGQVDLRHLVQLPEQVVVVLEVQHHLETQEDLEEEQVEQVVNQFQVVEQVETREVFHQPKETQGRLVIINLLGLFLVQVEVVEEPVVLEVPHLLDLKEELVE